MQSRPTRVSSERWRTLRRQAALPVLILLAGVLVRGFEPAASRDGSGDAHLDPGAFVTAAQAASDPTGARFVGEGRCANPTCHGAKLPASVEPSPTLATWPWARTLWDDEDIDRHSRAYMTLTTKESATIARYMGLGKGGATQSQKCLVCHAPDAAKPTKAAPLADGSVGTHQRKHGVSCEHCHGAAEHWLEPHRAKDWAQQKAGYRARGFIDLDDFRVRAEMCASCHVEIDHEIVAAGHPPLQFEMVAYAQVMQHWNDLEEHPGPLHPNPTLWALGQVVGLRSAAQMIARRAGNSDYQGLGKFEHFAGQNCYRCHHKLVDDAVRQAKGHAVMLEAALPAVRPAAAAELEKRWKSVVAAVASGPTAAQREATALAAWLDPLADSFGRPVITQAQSRAVLKNLVAQAPALGRIKRFRKTQNTSSASAVLRLDAIESPWWWTTGAPEQTCLAVDALCRPALGDERCNAADGAIGKMFAAVDRFDYDERKFVASLRAVGKALRP